ncbi:MAG: DUF3299 domain-containing protein [Sneathiellales bacterium]|nr:DUF3299 domain-containing protein [Sneathiellales bacterium]
MRFLFLLITSLSFLAASQAYALSETNELTPEERADFEANWKPIEVTGTAIPWKIFASTQSIENCKTDKEGYDECILKPEYTKNIMDLDGTEVTLMGFMFPLEPTENQKNFLIGPYPLSCPYHYHIGPENIVEVLADKGVKFSFSPVTIRGTLVVRYNEETGIFYYLENAHLP